MRRPRLLLLVPAALALSGAAGWWWWQTWRRPIAVGMDLGRDDFFLRLVPDLVQE
jgi:hypothetical protein